MAVGQPKYSDEQRRAVEHAKLSRNLPASAIVDLASRGELEGLDQLPIPAFEIKLDSVYSIANKARNKRSKFSSTDLVKRPRAEAMDALTDRLVEVGDRETQRMVEAARKHPTKPIDAAHALKTAQFLKALGAVVAMDGKPAAQTLPPEQQTNNKDAHAIFKAARGGGIEPAPEDTQSLPTSKETPVVGAGVMGEIAAETQQNGAGHAPETGEVDGPGSRAQAAIDGLLVQSVTSPQ